MKRMVRPALEDVTPRGPSHRLRRFVLLAVGVFLAAHLPFLAASLDDIDSINFALGIRHFDPAEHRPHPPGYPLYIALGKVATAALDAVRPPVAPPAAGTTRVPPAARGNEAAALAFWSALFGAVAIWPLVAFFAALDAGRDPPGAGPAAAGGSRSPAVPIAAALLTVACPLYWFTAVRPMSDLPGFATALAAQALLVTAFARQGRREEGGRLALDPAVSGRLIVAGAFASAIAIGFRSQAGWLTLPLVAAVLLDRAGRGAAAALLGSVVSFAFGVLLWAVPLVVATGGPARYMRAVFEQAGEDFSGVDMFLNYPSARRMVFGLGHTFVLPWGWPVLAVVVLLAALLGAASMLRRSRPALAMLIAAIGPYTVFHLLVHETITTRYALPILPAVAFLAARGLALAGRRVAVVAAAALAAAALVLTVPMTRAYGAEPSPLFRALDDVERAAGAGSARVLAAHHVFARGIEAAVPCVGRILASPPRHEWLELAKYWQAGGGATVSFLADPRRTDLALIDHRSRRRAAFYDWPFASSLVMSGVRPDSVEWEEIDPPGWFALSGWALTPETAGVARADGAGPGEKPIVARVRQRAGGAVMMLGGRNLAGPDGAAAVVEARFEGAALGRWVVEPGPRFFLEFADLPPGRLAAPTEYGELGITVTPVRPGPVPPRVAIEQFDLQAPDEPLLGFDTGWQEQEYSLAQGRAWRWTSESSVLTVRHGGHDLVLHLAGESPLRYFDAAPRVVVRAAGAVLARVEPASDFSLDVAVPRAALDAAGGRLTLETSRVFVPNERTHNGDLRHLGLRMYDVSIRPR
jgi:hypothetical protein